ncbi:MAG: NAD(P)-dependent oxidoreductase [Candidatus Omnitrophota bacterium]|nr:NAD(P)-dependent oxidoreductase [Candidatus Omnitrophota bacterium]
MNVLTTGVAQGLGRHLYEVFGGYGLSRENSAELLEKLAKEGVDLIIHAAFNATGKVSPETLPAYLEDNVMLTQKLTALPHKKFVYISSTEVYPKNEVSHSEEETLDVESHENPYSVAKIVSETIVRVNTPNHLIIRCAGLLGQHAKKGNLKKIFEDKEPVLSLTPDSECNFVTHSTVSRFIQKALDQNLQGIYNIASNKNIHMAELADIVRKRVRFGEFDYRVGNIVIDKAVAVLPELRKTSLEVIKEFFK